MSLCVGFDWLGSCLLAVCYSIFFLYFFFFKQKPAYEMRISDWSSDVCSSDLRSARAIIASASEAVVVCDSDGRITHVNAAAYAIQPGDLVGKYFHDAINLVFPNASGIVQSDDLVALANSGRTLQGIEPHADRKSVDQGKSVAIRLMTGGG